MNRLYVVLWQSLFVGSALAGVFEYKVVDFPKKMGTCHEAALIVGNSFTRATGLPALESFCEKADEAGYALTVRYENTEKLKLVTTGVENYSMGSHQFFSTEKDCLILLPDEVIHFEEVTKLRAVVSYCISDALESGTHWSFKIDALGSAHRMPFYSDVALFGKILGYSKESFLKEVVSRLKSQGVDARLAAHRSSLGMGMLTVFYYGAERLRFEVRPTAKVFTSEQCQENLQALDGFSQKSMMSFCAKQDVTGYFEVTEMFENKAALKLFDGSESYEGYSACMSDRARLLAYYRDSLKRPTVGILCGHGRDKMWHPVLFEDRM